MTPAKIKSLALRLLFALLVLVLASCGGGAGGGSQSPAPVSAVSDAEMPNGAVASPDDNLITVPFANTTSIVNATSAQALRSTIAMAQPIQASGAVSNPPPFPWISQYATGCSSSDGDNALNFFCGPTSVLMGAVYLNASGLNQHEPFPADFTVPEEAGQVQAVGQWIRTIVTPNNLASCGVATSDDDLVKFASDTLKLSAEKFQSAALGVSAAESWISDALSKNQPVVALVRYQGTNCTLSQRTNSQGVVLPFNQYYLNSLTTPVVMQPCTAFTPSGHWNVITAIDATSVTVYDPDPYRTSSDGGIRRYTTSSLMSVMSQTNPPYSMIKLCALGTCGNSTQAYTTTPNPIVLSTNKNSTVGNTQPVVNALVPNAVFSATGLPDGLSMDTEGRIVGSTGNAGTYNVSVTMTSLVNGVLRYANNLITVVTQAATSIIENLQFITPSSLITATVGNNYLQPLGITGNAEAPTFSLVNGNLPQGLSPNLQNGQIVGTPTQPGQYSVDIQAATSTSRVTKTFTLVVNPAPATSLPPPQPVLSGINPPSVTGSDSQQTVVFTGSGFADGALVELTDTTNGGTYLKTPVSINSAGTEITISADFTSSPATWSVRIIPLTGNPSASITFPVVAPVSPGPIISNVSPSDLTAASAAQTIMITGTNFRSGAVVQITNLATGTGASVQPVAPTDVQLTVSYPFATATMWGVSVLNSDGTSSASTDILVNAPTSTVAPAVPSLVSPGTAAGPGTVLSNTTAPLSWSGDASATYYEVAVRDLGSGTLVVNTTTATPSYTSNLLNGEQYRWNAAACNAAGCSSFAAPLYFQTPQPTVAVPTPAISSLSITSVPGDSTTRSLTINGSNFLAGNVVMYRWGNPPGGSTASATVNTATQISTTFNPGGVADTIYVKVCQSASSTVCSGELAISVTAVTGVTPTCTLPQVLQNGACVTPTPAPTCTAAQVLTNGVCVTPAAIPATPTGTSPGSTSSPGPTQSSSTVGLSWGAVSGATSYGLGVRDMVSGALVVSTTTTGTSYTASLTAGGQYRWNVAACNTTGCSAYTTELYFQTPAAVPTISSVSPGSYPASGTNQTMTINGANFQSGATLTFVPPEGGTIASTASKLTFVSSSQLSYQFNDGSDVGTWSVKVNNPGGQSTGTVSFSVP